MVKLYPQGYKADLRPARRASAAVVVAGRGGSGGVAGGWVAGWVGAGVVAGPPLLVGGEEAACAGARFELPALVGLEAVVVGAEPVEVGELGDVGVGPVDAVVDLEVFGGVAAEAGAADVQQVEDGLLAGGGAPAEVGDVEGVDAVGEHDVDGGLGEEAAEVGEGDGAEAGDVAELAGFGVAPAQGGDVAPQD